jgi:hypothetical protein
VKIQALSFSADESMLASLGGQDDNSLVSAAAIIAVFNTAELSISSSSGSTCSSRALTAAEH